MRFNNLSICFLLLLFLCSCNADEMALEVSDEKQNLPVTQLLNYIKSLGIAEENIIDQGDHFLLEGDMRMSKKMQVIFPDSTASEEQAFSSRYGLIWRGASQNDIKVKIGAGVQAYRNQIREAMGWWNNTGSRILFREVESSNSHYDVLITEGQVISGAAASSDLPFDGEPGINMLMAKAIFDRLNAAQRIHIIAHELGHAIGFFHTGTRGFDVVRVVGTPATDANSIMNAGGDGGFNMVPRAGLSVFDRAAVRALYPKTPYGLNFTGSTLSWYGPIHKILGYSVWYKVSLSATGAVLAQSPPAGTFVNLNRRSASLQIPTGTCECGPITIQAKVRTYYNDHIQSAWSGTVTKVIN